MNQARQPQGTPIGGQFAAAPRNEPTDDLPAASAPLTYAEERVIFREQERVRRQITDEEKLNSLSLLSLAARADELDSEDYDRAADPYFEWRRMLVAGALSRRIRAQVAKEPTEKLEARLAKLEEMDLENRSTALDYEALEIEKELEGREEGLEALAWREDTPALNPPWWEYR